MTITSNAVVSTTVVGKREDFSDVIYNVDPFDTPFMSAVGRGSAKNVQFDWQMDKLAAPGDNAVLEGDESLEGESYNDTDRLSNLQQISRKVIAVTGTNEVTNKAGRASEMAYQLAKRSKELKTDMEYELTGKLQAKVARAGATIGKTANVYSWLKTNLISEGTTGSFSGPADGAGVNNHPDGTALPTFNTLAGAAEASEVSITSLLQSVYTNSGKSPDLLIVTPHVKTVISKTWLGRATEIQSKADNKTAHHVIDFYVSDFGSLRMVPSRIMGTYATDFGTKGVPMLALDTSAWSIDYLRQFHTVDLAKTGDAEKKALMVEYGLRCNNEQSSGAVYGVRNTPV